MKTISVDFDDPIDLKKNITLLQKRRKSLLRNDKNDSHRKIHTKILQRGKEVLAVKIVEDFVER